MKSLLLPRQFKYFILPILVLVCALPAAAEGPEKPILWDKNEKSGSIPSSINQGSSPTTEKELPSRLPDPDSEVMAIKKDISELKERVVQLEKKLAGLKIQESIKENAIE